MKIGVDISQLAFPSTGVANYLSSLLDSLLSQDSQNEYIFFFSSLRGKLGNYDFLNKPNSKLKKYPFPPSLLNILWNRLHILPIEALIGRIDVFVSSDWTEPPVMYASKATILYDLIVYKYPNETAKSIVDVQKKKLEWVKKETDRIMCISNSTKKDAEEILGLSSEKLIVINAGV